MSRDGGCRPRRELSKPRRASRSACYGGADNPILCSKGFCGYGNELLSTNRSDKPGAIMDRSSFRCVGANTSPDGRWLASDHCLVAKRPSEPPNLAIVALL